MRIEQLIYFVEVTKTRSFSISAKNLYVSKSTISKAITALEEELGYSLLERSTTEIVLTPFALNILPLIVEVVEAYNQVLIQAKMINTNIINNISDSLNILVEPVIANILFPDATKLFLTNYPNVNINFINEESENLLETLQKNNVDVIFLNSINNYIQNLIDGSNLFFNVLFYEKLFLLANKNSPILSKKTINLTDIKDYPIITANNILCYEVIYKTITHHKFEPKLLLKTNNHLLMQNLLENNLAVCIVTNLSLRSVFSNEKNIKAIPLKHSFKVESGYLTVKNNKKKFLVEEFIKYVKLANQLY